MTAEQDPTARCRIHASSDAVERRAMCQRALPKKESKGVLFECVFTEISLFASDRVHVTSQKEREERPTLIEKNWNAPHGERCVLSSCHPCGCEVTL